MRYTHKLKEPDGNCNYFLIPNQEECDAAENKLGQLEDILDKYEIDSTEELETCLQLLDLIIFKDVDMWLFKNANYENYIRIREQSNIDSKVRCVDGAVVNNQLTKEDYQFMERVLLYEQRE